MAIQGVQITVGTAATALNAVAGMTDPVVYNQTGQSLIIQNPTGGATVYLGGSTVTTVAYGYALAANTALSIDLGQGEQIFGVVATGTQAVGVLRKGA